MKMSGFFRGLCVGMVAGVAIDMLACDARPKKHCVGKAMQRFGNAMDCALEDVKSMLH